MSSEMQQPPKTYLATSGSSFGIPYINSRTPSSELQTGHLFFMIESYREPLTREGGGQRARFDGKPPPLTRTQGGRSEAVAFLALKTFKKHQKWHLFEGF